MRLLGNRILVEKIKKTETEGGIILPDDVLHDEAGRGKVQVVGNEVKDIKLHNIVLYQWGDKVTVDGKELVLVNVDEVIAIL